MDKVDKICLDKEEKKHRRILCIDLGTTNCVVGFLNKNLNVDLVKMEDSFLLPSVAMWKGGDNFEFGENAKLHKYEEQCAHSYKTTLGTDHVYTLKCGDEVRDFNSVDLQTELLKEIKRRVSKLCEVEEVIISVPSNFSEVQLNGTREAVRRASLTLVRFVKEPTAAAVAFYKTNSSENIGVFDLGGGTFDFSIVNNIEKSSNVLKKFKIATKEEEDNNVIVVKSTFGDTHLGGENIDTLILEKVLGRICEENNLKKEDIDNEFLRNLKAKCLLAKEKEINLTGKLKNKDTELKFTISQSDLSSSIKEVVIKCLSIIDQNIDRSELSTILLCGGSTKGKLIRRLLKDEFPKSNILHTVDPDLAVGIGATLYSETLLNGKISNIFDVIPSSIGILLEGKVKKILKKNSQYSSEDMIVAQATEDGQEFALIEIYQGESEFPEMCTRVGRLKVSLPTDRPNARVSVKLSIDANGQLTVTANSKKEKAVLEINTAIESKTNSLDIREVLKNKKIKTWENEAKIKNCYSEEFKRAIEDYTANPNQVTTKAVLSLLNNNV